MGRPKLTEQQFWQKIDKTGGPKACWPWTAGRFEKGYGCHLNRKAHRVAWELANGKIPSGKHCLHRCDNPPCCNPEHLFIGAHKDNMRDKCAKRRQSSGNKHSAIMRAVAARGERAANAKLTAVQVLQVRAQYQPNKRGFGAHVLARRFGVAKQTIQGIVSGKLWKHLTQGHPNGVPQ